MQKIEFEVKKEIELTKAIINELPFLSRFDVKKILEKIYSRKLTQRQVEALKLRFGLEDDHQMTYYELAKKLKFSRSRGMDLVDCGIENLKNNKYLLMAYSNCDLDS